MLLRFRAVSFVFTAWIAVASALLSAQSPAVRNFDRVNDHVFRGGEPSLVGLQELGAMGVKIDIDLRQPFEGTEAEKRAAEKLGIKYVNIPLNSLSAPSSKQVERVLSLLTSDDSKTVFVHCRRGKDRTGTVIACYRIEHDHWNNGRALEEARRHGMSFAEWGMKSYVLHFVPAPLGNPPVVLH